MIAAVVVRSLRRRANATPAPDTHLPSGRRRMAARSAASQKIIINITLMDFINSCYVRLLTFLSREIAE